MTQTYDEQSLSKEEKDAIQQAIENIGKFHNAQLAGEYERDHAWCATVKGLPSNSIGWSTYTGWNSSFSVHGSHDGSSRWDC